MTRQVRQIFGQPGSIVSTYVGPSRELVVNTDTNRIHVQDGSTPGGFPLQILGEPTPAKQYAAATPITLQNVLDDSAIRMVGQLTIGTGATAPQIAANTAALNAATLEAKTRGNGVPVILPAGTVMVNTNVLIRDNAPIIGKKGYSTLMLSGGNTNGNMMLTENYTDVTKPTKNIRLEGFTLDMNASAQTLGGSLRGIGIAYSAGAVLRDITIQNVVDMGLWWVPDFTLPYGNTGTYGGYAYAPNRPNGDPWASTDVLIEHCIFDGRGHRSAATDFIIPVGIQRLRVHDNVFYGTNRNTLGPEWCREVEIRGNKFYGCASGIYCETLIHGNIENNYFEGSGQINQADWNSALHNTAIWLATADDTLGTPTVNQYAGSMHVKIRGNEIYSFSRGAPVAGNTTAGGVRGIVVSARNPSLPASDIEISENIINTIQGLGFAAGLGAGTYAMGIGIQTAGAIQDVTIHDNKIKAPDKGIRCGGPYPDSAATLGTITPSNDSHDGAVVSKNDISGYTTAGMEILGSHSRGRWEKNRFSAGVNTSVPFIESATGNFAGGIARQNNDNITPVVADWITSTPAPSAIGTPGTFAGTSLLRYKYDLETKTVLVELDVTISAIGTATGFQVTMPVTPAVAIVLKGIGLTSGTGITAYGTSGSATMSFYLDSTGALATQAQNYSVRGLYRST